MSAKKIPATIITGFLGAGKTTLVRSLLQTAGGKRIALIINEFGDLGIDGDVLKECTQDTCRQDDIIELTNGCICCTVADDFAPAIEKIMQREEKPDHIVIETSGLALPKPLVNAFNWPDIRERVIMDGVVAVIDSRAVADGRFASDEEKISHQRLADEALDHESPLEELFEDQLVCADLIILNKADLVEESVLEKIRDDIEIRVNRSVRLVHASNGNLPAEIVLGLDMSDKIRDREQSHGSHEHDHDHDEFVSFVVTAEAVSDREEFISCLQAIIEDHDILRLKGFAKISGKPMRLVVQAVGKRVDAYFDREWGEQEMSATRLVVIGLKGLDQSIIVGAIGAAASIQPE